MAMHQNPKENIYMFRHYLILGFILVGFGAQLGVGVVDHDFETQDN